LSGEKSTLDGNAKRRRKGTKLNPELRFRHRKKCEPTGGRNLNKKNEGRKKRRGTFHLVSRNMPQQREGVDSWSSFAGRKRSRYTGKKKQKMTRPHTRPWWRSLSVEWWGCHPTYHKDSPPPHTRRKEKALFPFSCSLPSLSARWLFSHRPRFACATGVRCLHLASPEQPSTPCTPKRPNCSKPESA